MNSTVIVNELVKRGYEATEQEVIKNGIRKQAILVKIDSLSPTFYLDNFKDMSEDEVADRIEDIVLHSEHPVIDAKAISERSFILENVIPAVQKKSSEDIVKYELLDLEIYFRVRILMEGQEASYKVSEALIKSVGIEKKELFERAMFNIRNHIHICSMAKMMCEKMGFPYDESMEELPMYVAYSDYDSYGASAILCEDKIAELAERLGTTKLALLPSSIHEWIILKLDESTDIDMLSDMVQSVNISEVSENEILSDHAYIWDNGELLDC